MKARQRRKGMAQRREVLLLLPAALVVVVLLCTYTLISYRGAVDLALEERQTEARQQARQLASELVSARSLPDSEELRRRWPRAQRVALLDSDGSLLVGDPTSTTDSTRRVVGTASFQRGADMLTVQVELPAVLLLARQRSLEVLSPVVWTINGAIVLLVLLFLRRLLAPFDHLIERARDVGRGVSDAEDDVAFLVETFETALEALARPERAPEVDELEALEQTLAQSLESGVLLLDPAGTMLALNAVGRSLLGIEEPAIGKPMEDELRRHPELVTVLGRALRRERSVQREECSIEGSDGPKTLGVTAHPLRRDDATLRGFLVMFADLTEARKESEQRRLADSLSQLGELTAGVAHELRNSLATLRGYLTLIERNPEHDSIHDYLGEIRHESDHLKRVLEDFLMFARPGSVRPESVDLRRLLHRAAADPALGEGTVRVEVRPAETVEEPTDDEARLVVQGDPQLLERALRNVLSNAVHAQADAGREEAVAAFLTPVDGGVEICVEDRGEGISPELADRLFDPFFSQRVGGVGLGLALTRRIVLLHAGRIELENRSSGGARASLWLPYGKMVT